MNFKLLVTAGLTAMLPLGLVFLPTDKAQSQASCGVQDPNIGRLFSAINIAAISHFDYNNY